MTTEGVCANCGVTVAGESLEPFAEGLRCRAAEECDKRLHVAREAVARQLEEVAVSQTRSRGLRPSQEQQLREQFGLTMADLELTPVRLRDATLRYTCKRAGHEGCLFIWQTVAQRWDRDSA